MQIYSSKNIFFQYVNRNIIITDCFLSVEIFNFPNNIDLFNGINRSEVSLIYILHCCNAGASSLLILVWDKISCQAVDWRHLDPGIWGEDTTFEK